MATLNKVILIGRLTRDPEQRQVGTTTKASFGIAVNERRKDKNGGWVDNAVFIDVQAWGNQAEFCTQWLKKGTAVIIDGKLRQETWDDKNGGGKRSKLLVDAFNISFAESRGQQNGGDAGGQPSSGGQDAGNANANDYDF